MVNLRSRSKGKAVAARAAPKMQPAVPVTAPSAAVPDSVDLSEAALRKLPRVELQKLAMVYKVKANIKTQSIIQQLSSLRVPTKTRPAEDDHQEGPSRKRLKREAVLEEVVALASPANQVACLDTQPTPNPPAHVNIKDPQPPMAGPSSPRESSVDKAPTALPYDQDLFSGTESEMTEEEQLDYATPVSSRAGTPPLAHVDDLRRCVTIMQEISAKDAALLDEVAEMRETAVKLRKRARDVRDVVKAERGRRERMEAYFRYWQEIDPVWDREWLFGEKMVPEYKIRLEELDEPAGPPTLPAHQHAPGAQNAGPGLPPTCGPARRPLLSPEEVKQKRQAIIAKQEAEQRELEALWRRELRREYSFRGGSSFNERDLDDDSSPADLPSADEDTEGALVLSYTHSVDSVSSTHPAPRS